MADDAKRVYDLLTNQEVLESSDLGIWMEIPFHEFAYYFLPFAYRSFLCSRGLFGRKFFGFGSSGCNCVQLALQTPSFSSKIGNFEEF